VNDSPSGPTFLGAPLDLEPGAAPADYAFLGVRYGAPYDMGNVCPPAAAAPQAVRAASAVYRDDLEHYDFDLGGPLFPKAAGRRLVDCGDVPGDPRDLVGNVERATAAVRSIVVAGAVPLVLGGDHAIPPLVVRGLDDAEPLDVLHIDAHLDFRDEVGGVRDGYSSPIRRLRELPWVRTIVQVGLRDIGSARPADVEAALAAGNVLVRAEEVHERGVDWIVESYPADARVYITVDIDGLDPGCAPGTLWPAPGGLQFWQAARLVRGLAGRCRLAGMDVCEFAPARDPQGHTALVITRLLMIAMGSAARRRA
jgi:agmatinase